MYLCVDIGGMSIKCGLMNEKGEILTKKSMETPKGDPLKTIEKIADLCRETSNAVGINFADVKAIGTGVPGTVHKGVVTFAPNIGWTNVPYTETLSRLTLKPCYAGNDANCALIGEWKFGKAKGYNDVVAITLGTGVGLAVIVDGKLLLGNGSAGTEGGHVRIKERGKKCACGRYDCWELYASTTSLLGRAKEVAENNPDSIIASLIAEKGLNGFTVFEADSKGDKLVAKAIDEYINDVCDGLTNYVNIFRPELIVLGGGISAQSRITDPIERKVNTEACGGENNPYVKVVPAEFFNDAGLIGAGALAMLG